MRDAVPGEAYDTTSLAVVGKESPETLAKFNPGLGPQEFDQLESAKFVPKGSDLVFNLHYTAIGTAATDRFSPSGPSLLSRGASGPTQSALK